MGAVLLFSSCQQADSPSSVGELRCEFQENPIGIDRAQPLLQWKIKDDRRGANKRHGRLLLPVLKKMLMMQRVMYGIQEKFRLISRCMLHTRARNLNRERSIIGGYASGIWTVKRRHGAKQLHGRWGC
jgi:hypothetical protein